MHRLARVVLAAVALAAAPAFAAGIFDGDPTDPADGTPYAILPGVPLILHQPGRPNDYEPLIVDTATIGDVDLVVRAGTPGIGPVMPPPAAVPPTGVAGGVHLAAGSEIPFTVIASTGGAGVGAPLGGTSLDLMPVVVFAWADLDGDGFVGPTSADAAGGADNGRELQEALFPVGRQVAIFDGGVAQGTVALSKGAPASAGGLTVVLTAVAFIGPFDPTLQFLHGNVPEGPGVATLLPFFPRLDPDRVIDGNGAGGKGDPNERLGVVLEPAFNVPVGHPLLGTPFALPTDGTSPTIDRAIAVSGPASRARFVQPSSPAVPALETQLPLARAADGSLVEPLASIDLVDDGPGNGSSVHLVPADALDDVTDPASPLVVTLVAGPGLAIAAPDTDGNPASETVALANAAGITVLVDDAGAVNDSGAASTLTVVMGGFPVESLAVHFTPGIGGGGVAPVILGATLAGMPAAIEAACPSTQTIAAVIEGTGVTASAALAVGGVPVGSVALTAGSAPAGVTLPPGPIYRGDVTMTKPPLGQLAITVTAANAAGDAAPLVLDLPVVAALPPIIGPISVSPAPVVLAKKTFVVVTAPVRDACGKVGRVQGFVDAGLGFKRGGRLADGGRKVDLVAGDGVFSGRVRVRTRAPGTFALRIQARDKTKLTATSPAVPVVVVTP